MSTTDPSAYGESPLDPDEPHTPLWFTFLGLGLFLIGGIFLLASQGDEEEVVSAPAADSAEAAPEAGQEPTPQAAPAEADPHAGHGHD